MLDSFIFSIFTGIITMLVAYITQYFNKKLRQKEKNTEKQLKDIGDIIEKKESQRVTNYTEKILEKMPTGLQLDDFKEQLNVFAKKISKFETPDKTELDAVENLINSYHEQALEQAKIQFWFSVTAASIGFALIIYTGSQIDSSNLLTTFKILPGVVMDSVAFLFFKQASATRERATELYDRLRTDKRNSESISLVASIEDEKVKSAVKAQIALHLAGLAPNPIDLTNFLSGNIKSEQ